MFIHAPRRLGLYIITASLVLLLVSYNKLRDFSWRGLPLEAIGLGEEKVVPGHNVKPGATVFEEFYEDGGSASAAEDEQQGNQYSHTSLTFMPGSVMPQGHKYTKALVVPRKISEDVEWIAEYFGPGHEAAGVTPYIYVVDDPSSELRIPKNKGHEVMIYLTYIIDHYDEGLADVNIFMHSHRFAWHNNEILDLDAVQMVNRLSAERVQREGFMNMRCHWHPGCPAWMHPGQTKADVNKQEETLVADSWSELFPMDPVPSVLAQPCCAQFAISRARIQEIPKARYIFYRDWLLRTPLPDYLSGRVWEYLWQYVFTGQSSVCPLEHVCYCDGYGVCFGGADQYKSFMDHKADKDHFDWELEKWMNADYAIRKASASGTVSEDTKLTIPEFGKDEEYKKQIEELSQWLKQEKKDALERGNLAKNRAAEAGRVTWKEGDGF